MAIFSYLWLYLVMKCYMAILGYLLLYVAAVHEYIWINHCQSGRGEMEVTGCQPIMDHLQAAYIIVIERDFAIYIFQLNCMLHNKYDIGWLMISFLTRALRVMHPKCGLKPDHKCASESVINSCKL